MYKYLLVRRAAAYSMIIIYQVLVLCCETAHGVYVKTRETTVITTHRAAAAAAAAAALLCMHIKLTSRLLRRHLNHRTYFYTGTKKHAGNVTKKTKKAPSSLIRTTDAEVRGTAPTCSLIQVLT